MADRRRSFCGSKGRGGGYNKRTKLEPSPGNNSTSAEDIPDDILATEIFPRLADARTVIRCSVVSKRWGSHISAADFIPNFVRRHRAPTSFTMFAGFRFTTAKTFSHDLNPSHLTVDGANKITAEIKADFRFNRDGSRLDSASGEFLLISRTVRSGWRKLYVRNIITNRTLALPELPPEQQPATCALVTHPGFSTLSHLSYSVLCVNFFTDPSPGYHYTLFSSETGRWSDLAPAPMLCKMDDVVAHRGLLFWLQWLPMLRLAIFDALARSWRYVEVPGDLLEDGDSYHGSTVEFVPIMPREADDFITVEHRARIGIVQGRVRMAQIFRAAAAAFVLKIWELRTRDLSTWRLVKEVCLEDDPVVRGKWMYVFALDPGDRDAVFLSCDRDVYRYRFSRGSYVRVLGLSCETGHRFNLNKVLPRFSHVLTVNHPVWPTALPSSNFM